MARANLILLAAVLASGCNPVVVKKETILPRKGQPEVAVTNESQFEMLFSHEYTDSSGQLVRHGNLLLGAKHQAGPERIGSEMVGSNFLGDVGFRTDQQMPERSFLVLKACSSKNQFPSPLPELARFEILRSEIDRPSLKLIQVVANEDRAELRIGGQKRVVQYPKMDSKVLAFARVPIPSK
jgi:hypothetical protein